MKLQAIPLGTTFLSSNLKVGLLAGIVGVSASTGAVATSFSSKPLGSAFKGVFDPIKDFLNSNISPHFEQIFDGAKKVGDKLRDWTISAYGQKDQALQWVKENFSSSLLKSGFEKIYGQTKDWGSKAKSTFLSAYSSGQNTVIPFLSKSENVRNLLYYGSEASNILKALGTLLAASTLSAATGGAGHGSSGDEDEEDDDLSGQGTPHLSKIWELVSGGNLGDVVSSITKMVSENMNVVKQLENTDVNKIINFVLEDSSKVKPRIDEMQKDKTDGKKSDWGSYESKDKFMEALIPPPNIVDLLKGIFDGAINNFQEYVSDDQKIIPESEIKKILPSCEGSADPKDGICTSGGTLNSLLTKLLESITKVVAAKE